MEKFRPRLNKQINSAYCSAHYLHPSDLHKRLDFQDKTRFLLFLNNTPLVQNTRHLKISSMISAKKSGVFGPHVDAWENVENEVLFWRKMASIPYNFFINTIS